MTAAACRTTDKKRRAWHAGLAQALATITAASLLFGCAGVTTTRVRSLKEIRDQGVVIQRWDTSCAAAAIATVLTYTFDDPVSEQEVALGMLHYTKPLRVRFRGGFSLLDMKRYVESRGYRATGFLNLNLQDLILFKGAIVPLKLHGYNHYVVFKGIRKNGEIWLGDPAFGNRDMSQDRFKNVWLNKIAFVIEKGAKN